MWSVSVAGDPLSTRRAHTDALVGTTHTVAGLAVNFVADPLHAHATLPCNTSTSVHATGPAKL